MFKSRSFQSAYTLLAPKSHFNRDLVPTIYQTLLKMLDLEQWLRQVGVPALKVFIP